jgi:hypothetical protein
LSDQPTVSNRKYPLIPRVANCVLGVSVSLGLKPTRVGMDEILEDAKRATGLSDLGDESFKVGMRQVIENADALGMTPLAHVLLRQTYLKAVAGRLQLQDHLKKHPEIRDIKVERPIFVVGFPRTGTTAMQNLLSLHPGHRGLQFWELLTPIPASPDPVVDLKKRGRAARMTLAAANLVAPEQGEIHDVRWDSYEECWYLFCYSFAVLNWDIMTGLNSYGEWLLSSDMRGPYEEYKTWLKVLLHQRPVDNLLLKCPEHLWFMDALLDTFPDACIVWTHRDPFDSVASYASLMSLTRRMIYGTFEPKELGAYIETRFLEGVTRAMEVRERRGDANFYDVDFRRLHQDPEGVLRDVCAHFDLPLPANPHDAVATWQDADRADKKGSHHYSPEMFGVDPDRVRKSFAKYIDRFNISVGKP